MDKFIAKYVLCGRCNYPELFHEVDKKDLLGVCNSCGFSKKMDVMHKAGKTLLKEIPSLLSAAKRRLLPLGQRTGRVEMSRAPSELLVTMTGNLQASEIPPIRSAVDEALAAGQSVRFDLSGLESLDSAALGFISLVVARQPEEQTLLTSCGFRPSLERTLSTQGLLPRLQPDSS